MQAHEFIEMDYLRTNDVLREDPSLYTQIFYGLLGVIAGLAGFMLLVL